MESRGRTESQSLEEVQRHNQSWWSNNPMTYDWHASEATSDLDEELLEEADRRFISAAFPYLSRVAPFDRVMPVDLDGVRVLEIGCGMGLHTELLARRGAVVTAIDLTEPAARATEERLRRRGLPGVVRQADAEELPFPNDSFDLVWSWGVIHHSSHTARIIRQIGRVLTPDGQARVMVYNRDARVAQLQLLRFYLIGRQYKTKSMDEVLWEHTDGFMARYFTRDTFDDVLRGFFEESSTNIFGQEPDVVPLPGRLRRPFLARLSDEQKMAAASKHGAFLFSVAKRPLRG